MTFELMASMMCADYGNLEKEVCDLEAGGIDSFHVDIMDGSVRRHFKWSGDCTVAANKNLPIKAVTHTACGKKRHAFFLHRTGKAV